MLRICRMRYVDGGVSRIMHGTSQMACCIIAYYGLRTAYVLRNMVYGMGYTAHNVR